MNLCRDCVFCLPGDSPQDPGFNARCENPSTASVNLVSGGTELGWCNLERTAFGKCGREGSLYVAGDGFPHADATVGASAMGG